MPPQRSLGEVLHKMLQDSDLSFRDFVEVSLYHPELGYYARPKSPIGKAGDFVTSPLLSPVFSFALSLLISEFVHRQKDEMCSIVDVGCGDGSLIYSLYAAAPHDVRERARFFGVDRSLERVGSGEGVEFTTDLSSIPRHDAQLIIANELFDALPFARLVMRDEDLHELWVTERDGQFDWSEHEA
ncbi:MAG TPA: SAM-dependent methyltransferase, partial [Thermoanaerobaculia bacterium]